MLVQRPVHAPPRPGDLHVRLVDEPAVAYLVPAGAGRVDQFRREPLHPPEQRDVIHVDTELGEDLLQVPVGKCAAQLPADREQEHLRRKPKLREHR